MNLCTYLSTEKIIFLQLLNCLAPILVEHFTFGWFQPFWIYSFILTIIPQQGFIVHVGGIKNPILFICLKQMDCIGGNWGRN